MCVIGESLHFIEQSLGTAIVNINNNLWRAFSNQLTPFCNLNKEKSIKTKNKVVSMNMSSDLYQKKAMIAQKQSVNLKSKLKYPLGLLLLSLAEV